ncbi:DEAD/DEAH box helicase [Methylobacterium symbioticum]|uniref:Helicase HelY n=1 Tax=Methylobacterium symbioticum TaxID=2584084 RepID=A0A509E963_9HYPH|nr:DEAD/DEAH box helicase [Methylobacterium symbioticum]VUD70039.1 hypothetical protein MET9862_00600 [Methylobacterium symbioticum]
MSPDELRSVLGGSKFEKPAVIRIFREITSLVNAKTTHDLGREMVIRALDVRDRLPAEILPLLDSLVQTTGLLPYLNPESRKTLEDFALHEAHKIPNVEGEAVFHSLQLKIYNLIMSGINVVLSATTSVGKSMIVDSIIASSKFKKIVIVVPTIALIDETRRRLIRKFGETHTIITHQSQERVQGKPVLYVLTQERVLARKDLTDVDFFVIDEFYKLDLRDVYDERAIDLNLCFHKLAMQGAVFYLIGPHVHEVRGLAERYNHYFIPSQYSTVAVDVVQFNLPKKGEERLNKAVDLCTSLEDPTLVYCQSPSKAAEVAEALIGSNKFKPVKEMAPAVDWLSRHFPKEWTVIRALQYGIGIHHANVPRAIQQFIIRSFEENTVKILICTSTIIEGVNTVAKNVVIYDRRVKTSNINYFTFKNIAGRAGRMGSHFVGKVFILEEPPAEDIHAINLPIEEQTEHTPLPLLLDLPEEDLAPISRERIQGIVDVSPLNLDTIKANRHIPVEIQNEVANLIKTNSQLRNTLAWTGVPEGPQLNALCGVIFEYFGASATLKGHQIHSGEQLAACLTKLKYVNTLREFIEERLIFKRGGTTVSESVEDTLKLLRKYIGYKLPKQIMALDSIHRDVSRQFGSRKTANYEMYAASVEGLFIDSGLFALDEYGIPPELTKRFMRKDRVVNKLDDAINLILTADVAGMDFHPFEKTLLDNFRSNVRPNLE